MRSKWYILLFFCTLVFSCAKEENTLVFWVDPDTDIYFDFLENEKTFHVYNIYNKSVSWEIVHNYDFMSVYPQSGILEVKDSVKITVSIDRNLFDDIPGSVDHHPAGKRYSSYLLLNSTGRPRSSETVGFNVKYFNHDYLKLDGNITDARYDRVNDLLILVQNDPDLVKIINPETGEFETVELSMKPTSLSVSFDGKYAAIGHLGWFTLLNLQTLEIENIYHVAIEVLNLIIAPNNWVYLYSDEFLGQIMSFDLENELIAGSFESNIPVKSKGAVIHPSGNYIYLPGWPEMLVRHSIADGPAVFSGISALTDYHDCTHLWISDDGERLFTNRNHVINTHYSAYSNFNYAGTLEGGPRIITALDHHSGTGKIALVRCVGGATITCSDLIILNDHSLKIEQELEIPRYMVPITGQFIFRKLSGRYGFFNSDGTRFYLLAHPDSPVRWNLVSFDIE